MGGRRKIKILQLINSLACAGAERQLLELTKAMDKNRFDVTVGYLADDDCMKPQFERAGIPVVKFDFSGKFDFGFIFRFRRYLQNQNYDIVHTYLSNDDIQGRFAARFAGVPIIVSSERNARSEIPRTYKLLKAIADRFTDTIIANSQLGKHSRQRDSKISPKKIRVIPNGFNLGRLDGLASREELIRRFPFVEGRFVLACIGRLTYQKQTHLAIEVVSRLVKQHRMKKVLLAIVGAGPEEKRLRELVEEWGLCEHVVFTGLVKNAMEFMQVIDALIMVSKFEGMPNVVMEAMALGKVVVASKVGAVPEMLEHGKSGFIFEYNDLDGMAAAILEMSNNGSLQREIGVLAKETIRERYSVAQLKRETESVYTELCLAKSLV